MSGLCAPASLSRRPRIVWSCRVPGKPPHAATVHRHVTRNSAEPQNIQQGTANVEERKLERRSLHFAVLSSLFDIPRFIARANAIFPERLPHTRPTPAMTYICHREHECRRGTACWHAVLLRRTTSRVACTSVVVRNYRRLHLVHPVSTADA